MAIIASTLARIKSDPLGCFGGKDNINQHFADAGYVWRDRVLHPANTLMLFILQVLHCNTAISHLRHLCKVIVADSSYCEARKRLPLKGLATLIENITHDFIRSIQNAVTRREPSLGRRVVLADASSSTAPDTPALQQRWPQPSVQKRGCGFPVIKLLGAMDLATGMILHLTMMNLGVQEMSQFIALHAALQAGDVVLADRGFCSFINLALFTLYPIDAVFRMHQRTIVNFTENRPHRAGHKQGQQRGLPTSRYVRRLGQEDHIVEWFKPKDKPAWIDALTYGTLPQTVQVRELRYRIATRGRRTRIVTIATTLRDPIRYPKRRIAELYGLRWEIETNFRHLKQTLRMDALKCKTVDGATKELMIFVLVYNMIRMTMTLAAARQGVHDANRVSFIDAMRWLCRVVASPPGDWEIELVINRIRVGRWHPRVKKRRMKQYDLMTKPRSEYAEPAQLQEVTT